MNWTDPWWANNLDAHLVWNSTDVAFASFTTSLAGLRRTDSTSVFHWRSNVYSEGMIVPSVNVRTDQCLGCHRYASPPMGSSVRQWTNHMRCDHNKLMTQGIIDFSRLRTLATHLSQTVLVGQLVKFELENEPFEHTTARWQSVILYLGSKHAKPYYRSDAFQNAVASTCITS